ncbi:MAG TPA: acyloxyacyl hydrolase [Deltaproteobacteria bacterium]|nr:acyloxyacyl hydrolase [Deltaproteobacteria bacterium]
MSDLRFSNMPRITGLLFVVLAVVTFIFTLPAFAEEQDLGVGKAKGHWTISGGFGTTHPGLGATKSRVETADLILSYGHFLTDEVGRSWYKGRHGILVELPIHLVVKPETTPMVGLTLLASWTFTASKTITPYIFGGGGLVYTDLDLPELGKKLNGTHQVGAGFHYFFKKNTSLDLSYRFHHISNAGTGKPNGPLNSSKILFGISFFR